MNQEQEEAIHSSKGPVLVLAGPGTGKTETIVERAIYLIQSGEAAPEEIMIATFSDRARDELRLRLTRRLDEEGISYRMGDLLIGTFHSLSKLFLDEFREEAELPPFYSIIDRFDQHYLVWMHWDDLVKKVPEIDGILPVLNGKGRPVSSWQRSLKLISFLDRLSEAAVDERALQTAARGLGDIRMETLGKALHWYQELMKSRGVLDFASLLRLALRLAVRHPKVLKELQKRIRFIMIDEYQDTTPVQEQFLRLLAGEACNICAVGDDDQALYRFRGATVENILRFKNRYPACRVIQLTTNYRSGGQIISFYSSWIAKGMDGLSAKDRAGCRMEKKLVSRKGEEKTGCVCRLLSRKGLTGWAGEAADLVVRLKNGGWVQKESDIAFLFSSLRRRPAVKALRKALEERGISVYAPREGNFFHRRAVRLVMASFLSLFPKYAAYVCRRGAIDSFQGKRDTDHFVYYADCLRVWDEYVKSTEGRTLARWAAAGAARIEEARSQGKTLPVTFTGLLYRLLGLPPSQEMIHKEEPESPEKRDILALSTLSSLFGSFERLYQLRECSASSFYEGMKDFFEKYIPMRILSGVEEKEEEGHQIPDHAVPFLTIHQSKGMEFPVVFVDSLDETPHEWSKDPIEEKLNHFLFPHVWKEPAGAPPRLDFLRKYYTAFSRAERVLILTGEVKQWTGRNGITYAAPSEMFRPFTDALPEAGRTLIKAPEAIRPSVQRILPPVISYTGAVAAYQFCPFRLGMTRNYHFYSESSKAALRGTLLHGLVEMIHREVLISMKDTIEKEKTEAILEQGIQAMANHDLVLSEEEKERVQQALSHYVDSHQGKWKQIVAAEWPALAPRKGYFMTGRVDLIVKEQGGLTIVDFKTGDKPDPESPVLESYLKELYTYTYFVKEAWKQPVVKIKLYYLDQWKDHPAETYSYEEQRAEAVLDAFDDAAQAVQEKKYDALAPLDSDGSIPQGCLYCPFRWSCRRDREMLWTENK